MDPFGEGVEASCGGEYSNVGEKRSDECLCGKGSGLFGYLEEEEGGGGPCEEV